MNNKICNYCQGDAIFGLDDANDGIGITVSKDGTAAIIESHSQEFYIDYCPKCGRRLTKEKLNMRCFKVDCSFRSNTTSDNYHCECATLCPAKIVSNDTTYRADTKAGEEN